MATLAQFLKTVDYKITESSEFGWACYGPHAQYLDTMNRNDRNQVASCVFDTQTQRVYEIDVHDEYNNQVYRWQDPDYAAAYDQECVSRGIDPRMAYDQVAYIEVGSLDDILEKARAVVCGDTDNKRVNITVDLRDDEILRLAMIAHEKDITLNSLIEQILIEQIEYEKASGKLLDG